MTVKQLIAELQECDPSSEVRTEGCDCHGDVAGVYLTASSGVSEVVLYRSDGHIARDIADEEDAAVRAEIAAAEAKKRATERVHDLPALMRGAFLEPPPVGGWK